MDWLRQIPIGQYVDGSGSWLRDLDPRLKLAWTLAFLLTPILAGPWWRLALVGLLLVITAASGLPWRLWRRTLPLLLALALLVGVLAALLPTDAVQPAPLSRPPTELRLVRIVVHRVLIRIVNRIEIGMRNNGRILGNPILLPAGKGGE
jgi:energy-coupling factor transport system permease protein